MGVKKDKASGSVLVGGCCKSIFLQMGSMRFQRSILNLNYFSICCHFF